MGSLIFWIIMFFGFSYFGDRYKRKHPELTTLMVLCVPIICLIRIIWVSLALIFGFGY